MNVYGVVADFEKAICDYTGAPYSVAVDNCCNALFLVMKYIGVGGSEVTIPKHTYPGVPCEIINAGAYVKFKDNEGGGNILTGAYQLEPYPVYDSALRFTADMYIRNTYMCCSFTGPYKHLKLTKGGCILTDNEKAYTWLKRARFSGRGECSYHEDSFEFAGWNYYMIPEIAARGLMLMRQFYELDGVTKKQNPDISIPYPNLSTHKAYEIRR
jgi:dTDP-4-amino-4,6-dideoxygalactose transaminase